MSNFTMTRGDSATFSGTVTLGGDPYDLSGAAHMWFTAKNKYVDSDEDAVFQKTLDDGITVVSPTAGLYSVAIVPADTEDVPKAKTILVWDVQIEDSEGNIYTMASGKLVINPDVTDA
jgi:hypothetical protein